MKNFIALLLILSITSSAFANDCMEAYGKKADQRHKVILALYGGVLVTGAGLLIAGTGGGGAVFLAATFAMPALPLENNVYHKLSWALNAAKENRLESQAFQDLAGRIQHQAYKSHEILIEDYAIADLLNDASETQTICPLVKIKKDGSEKRAVFSRSALIKYIANKAAGNDKIVIVQE